MLTFEPGETTKKVTVAGLGDTKAEPDETFRVGLNHASQPIAKALGLATILNDDATEVLARHVFYNDSAFDRTGNGLLDDDLANDRAIAPDKAALLPGRTATFANYTSYVRGINGVMIDVASLANAAELSAADDFDFRVEPFEMEVPHTDLEANIRHNTQRLNDVIEGWVREDPSQWLWLHKRWKVDDDPTGWDIPEELRPSTSLP